MRGGGRWAGGNRWWRRSGWRWCGGGFGEEEGFESREKTVTEKEKEWENEEQKEGWYLCFEFEILVKIFGLCLLLWDYLFENWSKNGIGQYKMVDKREFLGLLSSLDISFIILWLSKRNVNNSTNINYVSKIVLIYCSKCFL